MDIKPKSGRSWKRGKGETLNPTQISYIRKFNKNINDEYVFEVYFQLGAQKQGRKQGLQICHPRNKDANKRRFDYDGETIEYNNKIATLLEKIQDSDEIRLDRNYVDNYFAKVTRYLRDKVHIYPKKTNIGRDDLWESHKAYIVRCPNCHELTENIQQNWILARWESAEEYRLFCSQCNGDPRKGVVLDGN